MKHGKKLTLTMKKIIIKNNLNPDDYLCVKNQLDKLTLVNVKTNKTIEIMRN